MNATATLLRPDITTPIKDKGQDIVLTSWLPDEGRDIEISRFAALQDAYKGRLEIIFEKVKGRKGRVVILYSLLIYTASEAAQACERLRSDFFNHLGVQTSLV